MYRWHDSAILVKVVLGKSKGLWRYLGTSVSLIFFILPIEDVFLKPLKTWCSFFPFSPLHSCFPPEKQRPPPQPHLLSLLQQHLFTYLHLPSFWEKASTGKMWERKARDLSRAWDNTSSELQLLIPVWSKWWKCCRACCAYIWTQPYTIFFSGGTDKIKSLEDLYFYIKTFSCKDSHWAWQPKRKKIQKTLCKAGVSHPVLSRLGISLQFFILWRFQLEE